VFFIKKIYSSKNNTPQETTTTAVDSNPRQTINEALKNNNLDVAIKNLETLIKEDDKNMLEDLILLSNLCAAQNNYSAAQTYANKVIESDPQRPEGYMTLAKIALQSNQPDEVISNGLKALDLVKISKTLSDTIKISFNNQIYAMLSSAYLTKNDTTNATKYHDMNQKIIDNIKSTKNN
jgi:predicted Zn-dependent protease